MSAAATTPATLGEWWKRFDRVSILAAIEGASGRVLASDDPLPDTLIANAEALGLLPMHLRFWICDKERADWTRESLGEYAARYGFGVAAADPEKSAPVPV
jgi:hypothetical protein